MMPDTISTMGYEIGENYFNDLRIFKHVSVGLDTLQSGTSDFYHSYYNYRGKDIIDNGLKSSMFDEVDILLITRKIYIASICSSLHHHYVIKNDMNIRENRVAQIT